MENNIIIVRGGGDIGTGVICKLYRSGFRVLVLELEHPLVIRRAVSVAQALYDGKAVVEEISAIKAKTRVEIPFIWEHGSIPVFVDPEVSILNTMKPLTVIDATLAKRNTCMHKQMAPITIAVGPGFKAGTDVDAVIETNRGHNLGRIIFDGHAETDTGIPEPVGGYDRERVLRAPCGGKVKHAVTIGAQVKKGDAICCVDDEVVTAPFSGVVRGLIMDGFTVPQGLKIGDIDPRNVVEYCFTISDKARAVGGAVLEAILYLKQRKGIN